MVQGLLLTAKSKWGNIRGNNGGCSPMLTDPDCKNAVCTPGAKRERLADSGGLYLEVSPAGSKRWFWKYRKDGKEGRMSLGSYPGVGLKAARK
eukprot:gene6289-8341_t